MKKLVILALVVSLNASATTSVGQPHSDTAGPETTDIMGYGTPGGGGEDNELRTTDDERRSINTGTGSGDRDIDGDRPGSRSRSDTESDPSETKRNSQQRMEERQNNSSVIYDSDRRTSSDGVGITSEDSRPQGEEYNRDTSDFEVEEEE